MRKKGMKMLGFVLMLAILSQFLVFSSASATDTNVALNKTVAASSTESGQYAFNAVDGNHAGRLPREPIRNGFKSIWAQAML